MRLAPEGRICLLKAFGAGYVNLAAFPSERRSRVLHWLDLSGAVVGAPQLSGQTSGSNVVMRMYRPKIDGPHTEFHCVQQHTFVQLTDC